MIQRPRHWTSSASAHLPFSGARMSHQQPPAERTPSKCPNRKPLPHRHARAVPTLHRRCRDHTAIRHPSLLSIHLGFTCVVRSYGLPQAHRVRGRDRIHQIAPGSPTRFRAESHRPALCHVIASWFAHQGQPAAAIAPWHSPLCRPERSGRGTVKPSSYVPERARTAYRLEPFWPHTTTS